VRLLWCLHNLNLVRLHSWRHIALAMWNCPCPYDFFIITKDLHRRIHFSRTFSSETQFLEKKWHNPKAWARSFSGYRIFPDLSLGVYQDTYYISTWDNSQRNPTSGKKSMTIFVKLFTKNAHAHLTLDLPRWSVILWHMCAMHMQGCEAPFRSQ